VRPAVVSPPAGDGGFLPDHPLPADPAARMERAYSRSSELVTAGPASPETRRPPWPAPSVYDNVATTADSNVPANYWSAHQRVRQYTGDVQETWGGVTINIDRDYLDVAVTAVSCPACF